MDENKPVDDIQDIINKLKQLDANQQDPNTKSSVYNQILKYLEPHTSEVQASEAQIEEAEKVADDSETSKFKLVNEKLTQKIHESFNQLKYICKINKDIDLEEYLAKIETQSLDPAVELGMLLQIYDTKVKQDKSGPSFNSKPPNVMENRENLQGELQDSNIQKISENKEESQPEDNIIKEESKDDNKRK